MVSHCFDLLLFTSEVGFFSCVHLSFLYFYFYIIYVHILDSFFYKNLSNFIEKFLCVTEIKGNYIKP